MLTADNVKVGAIFWAERLIMLIVRVLEDSTKEAALSPPSFIVIGKVVTVWVELEQNESHL